MSNLRRARLLDGAWLVFWVVVSSVWCITAGPRLSATFDEPTYVRLGLERWRTGSSGALLDLGTMPLPMHVDTLPLYVWERWRGEPLDPVNDLDRLLPIARLGTLPFWWLLLVHAWLAARVIAGPWAGRVAVLLLACDPNLLAHATLATTDIPVTGCLLALFYHYRQGRDKAWLRRVALPAGCLALAILCKASGLVFGTLGLVALGGARNRQSRRELAKVMTLALVVVFTYCGTDGRPSPSFIAWTESLPEGLGRSALVWTAEHLRIFSNAGVALARQFRHNVQGHSVYLLGDVARRSFWYYFPAALSIKCPVPLLVLPLVVVGLCPRALRNWACGLALVFLLFTLVCRVQIGIRLVLPLIALAAVGLAGAMTSAALSLEAGKRRRALLTAGVVACAWTAIAAAGVWPDGLRYTNELWGGTANGYRVLSDSNYDWGQGLRELADWRAAHGASDLDVLHYGSEKALERLGLRRLPLGEFDGRTPEEALQRLRGRTVAVGTSILYSSHGEVPYIKPIVVCLRAQTPADRTGTYFIYRVPDDQARRP